MATREYEQLAWRIEVPVAARGGDVTAAEPQYALNLRLTEAMADPVAEPARTEAWLAADHSTLVRLTQALEEAVAALHAPPYGRIHRGVK